MNFFFGISNKFFESTLTIPKFQNNGLKSKKYYPFEAYINEKKWHYQKANFTENGDFFFIEEKQINNEKIFFLSNHNEVFDKKYDKDKLQFFNNYTKTSPVNFRCNLRITFDGKGFSSYQSEYPLDMVKKKGNILSPLSVLLNTEADQNFLFFRNIYSEPIKKFFKIFFYNLKTKTIVNTTQVLTNESNLINIDKGYINEDIYIFSDGFLGIPIFISLKNNHLSMEHTHPPHHYILSENKFKIITKLKNEIKNQIFK